MEEVVSSNLTRSTKTFQTLSVSASSRFFRGASSASAARIWEASCSSWDNATTLSSAFSTRVDKLQSYQRVTEKRNGIRSSASDPTTISQICQQGVPVTNFT